MRKETVKRLISLLLVFAVVLTSSVGTVYAEESDTETRTVSSYGASSYSSEVTVGGTSSLTIYLTSNVSISLTSGDDTIATASQTGTSTTITSSGVSYGRTITITGIKVGETTITVKYGSTTLATISVSVVPDTASFSGYVGDSYELTVVSHSSQSYYLDNDDVSIDSVSTSVKTTTSSVTVNGSTTSTTVTTYTSIVTLQFNNSGNFTFSLYGTVSGELVSISALISKMDASITASDIELEVGGTASVNASVTSGGTLSYASSDESVVTVSSSGIVTAISEGTAVITVTAAETDDYAGASAQVNVTVAPVIRDLSYAVVTLGTTSYTYNGAAKEPNVSVTLNGKTLTQGTDYTVSYSNNREAGTATVTVTGIGVYTGSVEKSFVIIKAAQTVTASADTTSLIYGESATISAARNGDGSITYESSDTSVVTVDDRGRVTTTGVGTAIITVVSEETDNYLIGTKEISFTVAAYELSVMEITVVNTHLTYDGTAQEPEVYLEYNGMALVLGVDYTMFYSNNTNAGTATVTVEGIGNFTGAVEVPFTISKASSAITASDVEVSVGDTVPIEASVTGDGDLSYTSSDTSVATVDSEGNVTGVSAGMAVITVTASGTDNYGSASAQINVVVENPVYDLSDAVITLDESDFTYTGAAIKPNVSVVYGTDTLKEGSDYTVSYSNNVNAGTATVTITGCEKYTGTASAYFSIEKASTILLASDLEVNAGETAFIDASVDRGADLTFKSSDTSVATVENNGCVTGVSEGTAVITITASETSNYNGASVQLTVTVTKVLFDLSDAVITLSDYSYVYTGTTKRPTVTVSYNGKELSKYADYSVSYSDNVYPGTATVTVTGKGNYTGVATETFTITKKERTVEVYLTASSIKYGETSTVIDSFNGDGQESYASSNTSVATVDSTGKITAVGAGTATITVSVPETDYYNAGSAMVGITVTRVSQSLSVSSSSVSLAVKKSSTPTVSGAKTSLTYKSSNTSVATVDSSGKITAKAVGTATITVTAAQTSAYSKATATIKVTVKPAAATISNIQNTTSGVKITWSKVTGATKYYVYRATSRSGTYTKIGETTSTSYTNKNSGTNKVSSGKTYYYKVYAYASTGKSAASSVKSIKYLVGKVSSLTNASNGITIKWSKVSGASGYYIYRKAGSGSYKQIAKVSASTVSYTNKNTGTNKVVNGTTYTYYVMPYYKSGSTEIKGTYSTTKKIMYLSVSKVSSLKNSSSKKMTVKWATNTKATGYQIQYSTSSSFTSSTTKKITVSSKATGSRTIGSLTRGKTYYVRVRSYKKSGSSTYYSAWSKKSVKISK